jgi:hypothetical protein
MDMQQLMNEFRKEMRNQYNYSNLESLILLSYRCDSTSFLNDFPIEIVYIILDFMNSTNYIEFVRSENTSKQFEKFHKGRNFPYGIGTKPYSESYKQEGILKY